MKITGSTGVAGMGGVMRAFPAAGAAAAPAQKDDFARRFDSVSLSAAAESGPMSVQGLELRGKLHQEVRAAGATPSETIASLREQIQNGSYKVDAMEIAKKMLLLGEAV